MRSIALLAIAAVLLTGAAPSRPGTSSRATSPNPPLTEEGWRRHPAIAAIRALVASNEAAVASGALRREAKRVCEPDDRPFASDRVVFRDAKGRVRKYVTSEGTDDSAYTVEHQLDARGRLRFVFARAGAANGAVVEHRLYLDEDGHVLWKDRRETGPGYTFVEDFPEARIARDPEKAWSAPPDCD